MCGGGRRLVCGGGGRVVVLSTYLILTRTVTFNFRCRLRDGIMCRLCVVMSSPS